MAASLVEAGLAAHSTGSQQDGASPPPSTAELTAAAAASTAATATAATATAATAVRAPPLYTSRLAAEVEAQALRTSAAVTPVTTSSSAAATAAATAAAAAARSSSSAVRTQQQHPTRETSSSSGGGSLGVHTGATADLSRSSSGPVGSSTSSSAVSSDNPFTMAWGDGWPKRFPALSAYASRAWCRCELFMATSVPMPPDGMCVYAIFTIRACFTRVVICVFLVQKQGCV
jgi:hypothetical protein